MASQTLILRNPNLTSPLHNSITILSPLSALIYSKPRTISLFSRPNSLKKFTISASSTTVSTKSSTVTPLITRSTRTITTLAAVTLAISKLVLQKISNGLGQSLVYSAGPMFFAALKNQPTTGALNTPFTVVAAGMAKWLDIYSGVLMVRVLLSWFPNIPWDRQPLSAIRDLCDPYLNLFRNIIPPIFDTLDVSPLLAFAVLGTLGSILNSSRGAY
ncbi:PREDICTED: ylmG homolog protein 1-2, chloroplastic-like [Nicotiana attenuata]|uniref:Ylmg -like protein 1-2, chloroplastic n=1 Tax=Nicotiana attenuata TaxID=49451 RepID=A0A1J6IPL5_NICAT|nr:PREDICTED: ylmG homolog protein 1-2, chloroplastic-like [Nicotiana attenuata]OIT06650.1 ylmg -like protein 1-2, chloroplastic [Nicotiana attenuata]